MIPWRDLVPRAQLAAARRGDPAPTLHRRGSRARVDPTEIDWTGYAHAGGDPSRAPRSGSSIPQRDRGGVQVLLRISVEDRAALRSLATAEGLSVSAVVVALIRAAKRARSAA